MSVSDDVKGGWGNGCYPSPTIPFAEPETALAGAIDAEAEECFLPDKTARPVHRKEPTTNYQSLPPGLNNLTKTIAAETQCVP
jgi:hypothetical protein